MATFIASVFENIFEKGDIITLVFVILLHWEFRNAKSETKGTSTAIFRGNCHLSSKVAHNFLAEIQSHSYSLLVLFAAALELAKDLEQFDLVSFFDTDSRINDIKPK